MYKRRNDENSGLGIKYTVTRQCTLCQKVPDQPGTPINEAVTTVLGHSGSPSGSHLYKPPNDHGFINEEGNPWHPYHRSNYISPITQNSYFTPIFAVLLAPDLSRPGILFPLTPLLSVS